MRLLTHSDNETFSALHGDTSKRQEFHNSADLDKVAKSYTTALSGNARARGLFCGHLRWPSAPLRHQSSVPALSLRALRQALSSERGINERGLQTREDLCRRKSLDRTARDIMQLRRMHPSAARGAFALTTNHLCGLPSLEFSRLAVNNLIFQCNFRSQALWYFISPYGGFGSQW